MALALALAFIDITMTGWSGVTKFEPRDCDGVITSLLGTLGILRILSQTVRSGQKSIFRGRSNKYICCGR